MFGKEFHQAVFPISLIQVKSCSYQYGGKSDSCEDAAPLVYAGHVHDYKQDKKNQQPCCEYKQVLALESFEFYRFTYSSVYRIFHGYRKKERKIVAATIRKIQAPNQEAAVLEVSGSPDENLLYTFTPPISPTTAPMA